jgi:hypothetical protein
MNRNVALSCIKFSGDFVHSKLEDEFLLLQRADWWATANWGRLLLGSRFPVKGTVARTPTALGRRPLLRGHGCLLLATLINLRWLYSSQLSLETVIEVFQIGEGVLDKWKIEI